MATNGTTASEKWVVVDRHSTPGHIMNAVEKSARIPMIVHLNRRRNQKHRTRIKRNATLVDKRTMRKRNSKIVSILSVGYCCSMTVWEFTFIPLMMLLMLMMMATTPTKIMVAPFQHSPTLSIRRRPSTEQAFENMCDHHSRNHRRDKDMTGSVDYVCVESSKLSVVMFASSKVVVKEEEEEEDTNESYIDMNGGSTLSEENSKPKVQTTEEKNGKKQRTTKRRRKRRTWNMMFPKLQAYYDEHGHSNVTSTDDPDLYDWVERLRLNYRGQIIRMETNTDVKRRKRRKSSNNGGGGGGGGSNDDDDDEYEDDDDGNNQSIEERQRQMLPDKKIKQLQDIKFSWNTSYRTSPLIRRLERIEMWRLNRQKSNITTTISPSLLPSLLSFNPSTRASVKQPPARKGRKKYKSWSVYFPKLVEFYNENGHSDVNIYNCGDGNEDLVEWVKQIRTRCRYQVYDKFPSTKDGRRKRRTRDTDTARVKGGTRKLSDQQLRQLEDLDFQWYNYTRGYYEPWNVGWSTKYERLVEFYREHGHSNPKRSEYPQLADFVNLQRKYYRRRQQTPNLVSGQKSMPLTDNRIDLLEKIDFEWGKSNDKRWKDVVEDLTMYKKEYGDTAVPQDFHKDPQLGHWVMNQRTFYRLREEGQYSPLGTYRISDLQNLGFVFKYRQQKADENWYEMLEWAQSYHAEHGNLKIPTSDTAHTRLRLWLNAQRVFYKRDKLAEESNEEDQDDERIGTKELDDTRQITRRRRPYLSQEKIEALEAIDGFRWSYRTPSKYPTSADWSRMFEALRDRGISADTKPKRHWFDGVNPLRNEVKSVWTEDELVALWYEEDDDDEDEYYEDEETQNFLRA